MVGCAPLARLHRATLPINYYNATLSVVSDNVLLFPQTQDKEFIKILASRLNDVTKAEIENRGSLKVIPACGPRTLKVVQEITGITANTVTDVSTGFFVFQLFRGSATSTKSDMIYINTTTSVIDCENGKTLGAYSYQGYGQSPIETLQSIAAYNVYYVYDHQRGQSQ
jgi:hypothetical protein